LTLIHLLFDFTLVTASNTATETTYNILVLILYSKVMIDSSLSDGFNTI